LLYVAATGVMLVARLVHQRRVTVADGIGFLPFAVPVAHLLWRHATYGEWVPNTYFAKHVGMWPLGGLFYSTSFLLEYAAWVPVGMAVLWAWRARHSAVQEARDAWRRPVGDLAAVAVVGTFAFEWAYYTFNIGGDHFEWRIYHHLVPVMFLAVPWLSDRLGWRPRDGLAALFVFVSLSWPLPWLHYWKTKDLDTRRETHVMVVFVNGDVPVFARGYALLFDLTQWWLIEHRNAMRHQEHKVFAAEQWKKYGARDFEVGAEPGDVAVHEVFSVGVPGWALPNVVIIDKLGLNDRVVARAPIDSGKERTMAHDRRPPKGYVECFRANVRQVAGGVRVTPHAPPVALSDLAACEAKFGGALR
jgi:arabinofuranosyltransferase